MPAHSRVFSSFCLQVAGAGILQNHACVLSGGNGYLQLGGRGLGAKAAAGGGDGDGVATALAKGAAFGQGDVNLSKHYRIFFTHFGTGG